MSERDILAGEYALRLLEGEELAAARRLLVEDPSFAAAVAAWDNRLHPLTGEVPERALPSGLWARIEQALDRVPETPAILALRRQVRRWKAAAGLFGAGAVAALIALLLVPRGAPPAIVPPPTAQASAPVLAASVATERSGTIAVTYLPDRGDLLVVPAALDLPAGRAAELWLIPAGSAPISLGLVGREAGRRPVQPDIAARFARGATIAVSDEPAGGSPTGQPTGAVLGSGILQQG